VEETGEIKFWDAFNLAPGSSVLSLGQAPDAMLDFGPVARSAQFALSLNWLSNLAYHVGTQTDFSGRKTTWAKSLLEAAGNFLPGGLQMPLSAVYRSMQTGAEKSLPEALFQALSGINVRVSRPGEDTRMDLQESAEAGHIKQIPQWMPQDTQGQVDLRLYNAKNAGRSLERRLARLRGE